MPHAVTETAISVQADAAGKNEDGTAKIGQGKLQGDIGNLIALIKVFVPMIYGQVYYRALRRTVFTVASALRLRCHSERPLFLAVDGLGCKKRGSWSGNFHSQRLVAYFLADVPLRKEIGYRPQACGCARREKEMILKDSPSGKMQ